MKTNLNIEQIAIEFSKVLNEWLTPEEINEVNIRNASPQYANCCASHDFCDANMAMDEAFTRLGGKMELLDDAQIQLVNQAWSLAKENKFNAHEKEEYFVKDNSGRGYTNTVSYANLMIWDTEEQEDTDELRDFLHDNSVGDEFEYGTTTITRIK